MTLNLAPYGFLLLVVGLLLVVSLLVLLSDSEADMLDEEPTLNTRGDDETDTLP